MDHIREAVSTCSRPMRKRCGVLETVPVVDLVEDALRMNVGALTAPSRGACSATTATATQVTVDRHKVLQMPGRT